MTRLIEMVNDSLDTRITPLAYIYGVKGITTGLGYGLLAQYSEGVQNSILYKEGALVGHNLWGIILLVGSIVMITGLVLKNARMVQSGSFAMFLSWAFASIVYALSANWVLLFPVAILEILACGYLYLAASLGRLWDYTPAKR